jgi:hypothetical protein
LFLQAPVRAKITAAISHATLIDRFPNFDSGMNLMKLVSNGILLTMKAAAKITLTEEERSALESLVRNPRTNRRVMMRARNR